MTGNQDRTDRALKRIEAMQARLDPMLDHAAETLEATRLEVGDALAVQRYVRAITLLGSATRTIALLDILPSKTAQGADTAEDSMADHERDDSPENLDRLRDELESRLARLNGIVEQKRLDRDAERRSAA